MSCVSREKASQLNEDLTFREIRERGGNQEMSSLQEGEQRQLSAVELAMMEELGSARLDTLPLQDNGLLPNHTQILSSIQSRRTGTNNQWNQAIAQGDFNDDDAEYVAGQETIADGQLARLRRAQNLSGTIGNKRDTKYDDKPLRQGPNGQVHPRARFSRTDKGPFRAGQRGGVSIGTSRQMFDTIRAPDLPIAKRGAKRGPSKAIVPSIAHGTHGPHSADARAQPAAAPLQSSISRTAQSQRTKNVQLELPNGYSVAFQTPVNFSSPSFADKNMQHSGKIFLVTESEKSDGYIVFRADEVQMTEVKKPMKEYIDVFPQSDTAIILQFKAANSFGIWFAVEFHRRDEIPGFFDLLQVFTGRHLRNKRDVVGDIKLPAAGTTSQATALGSGSVLIRSRSEAVEPARTGSYQEPTQLHAAEQCKDDHSQVTHQAITVSQQQEDVSIEIPHDCLEDIISWSIEIFKFFKEDVPDAFSGGGGSVLYGIVRGTTATVLGKKHQEFTKLDDDQRIAYIDKTCVPQFYEMLNRRILEETLRPKLPQRVQMTAPLRRPLLEAKPMKPRRYIYTIEELVNLRSAAEQAPSWLSETISPLEAICQSTGTQSHVVRDWTNLVIRSHKHRVADRRPTTCSSALETVPVLNSDSALAPPIRTAGTGDSGTGDSSRETKLAAGYRSDSIVNATLQQTAKSGSTPAATITTVLVPGENSQWTCISRAEDHLVGLSKVPQQRESVEVKAADPDETLISVGGEFKGLSASRHNRDGVARLGKSERKFTGVRPSYLEDLAGIS